MTDEQIAASRDYNLSVLWVQAQRQDTKPAAQVRQHMLFLSAVYDDMDTFTDLWAEEIR